MQHSVIRKIRMGKLVWTKSNLCKLGKVFLRKAMENMRENATVKFGETGKGIRPNYQVTFSDGRIMTLNGASHRDFSRVDEFANGHISQAFTFPDIERAYDGA
jgi:hypothetical protein